MQASTDAYNKGIALQNHQYEQTRSDYQPAMQVGTAAIGGLGDLAGINGADKQKAGIAGLHEGPLYSSLFNNGREALLQNASASGGLRGGNFERASMDFGADTLAQVYQQQMQSLGGLAGLGLGATGSVAGFGAHTADANTGLLGNIGQAQAANYLTKGGINAKNWANAGGFLDGAVKAGMPGGGGFSLTKALGSIF